MSQESSGNNENVLSGDFHFFQQALDQWELMESNAAPWELFKATRKNVCTADNDAAVQSLTEIINTPGLATEHYIQAYYFLNKLVAFSEEYFELYGVAFERSN